MKKMMNTLLSMLICTVMFSTCFGATTVCAAPSGKIEIQLKDLNTAHSNKTGVTFKLYLVGDCAGFWRASDRSCVWNHRISRNCG